MLPMIMIPDCYNESQNILNLFTKIHHDLRTRSNIEDVVVVVVDSSPDRTARRVKEYAKCIGTLNSTTSGTTSTANDYENDTHGEDNHHKNYFMKVIYRANNKRLIFAIVKGIYIPLMESMSW
jgi:glycosyltransferase involved in cell wall biosynthesis